MLVSGVPSMHICLDFMPELLSQPDLEKQIFAAELASHLALQFPIPRCYSTGRLVINTLTTLLGGRTSTVEWCMCHVETGGMSRQLYFVVVEPP